MAEQGMLTGVLPPDDETETIQPVEPVGNSDEETSPQTFTFVAGIETGSGQPNLQKVGTIPKDKVKEIAEIKMADLNASDIEGAMKIIAGTARSMGIDIEE